MKIDPSNLDAREVHELLVACIVPRPIAFVSTIGEDGVYNVAPFSFCTVVSLRPALIGFTVGSSRGGIKKDTLVNIEFTREFVVNVVPESIAEAMNQAAGNYPSDVDEFAEAGLTPVKSDLVRPPRVAESPIQLECKLMQILEFGVLPTAHNFIIGEVLRVHVREDLIVDGEVKSERLKAVGRMGAELYCRTQDIFEMKRVRIPPRS